VGVPDYVQGKIKKTVDFDFEERQWLEGFVGNSVVRDQKTKA